MITAEDLLTDRQKCILKILNYLEFNPITPKHIISRTLNININLLYDYIESIEREYKFKIIIIPNPIQNKKRNIISSQFDKVLSLVYDRPRISPGSISKMLNIRVSSINRILRWIRENNTFKLEIIRK